MSVSLESLGIDRLSIVEKVALVQAIWDDIEKSTQRPELSDELKAELDRRRQDARDNPNDSIPWDQAISQLEAQRSK